MLPARLCIGHIHFQVADLRAAEAFYGELLGFEEGLTGVPGVLFLAASGYHHHLAFSNWPSHKLLPLLAPSARLRFFTIELSDTGAQECLSTRLDRAGVPVTEHSGAILFHDPWRHGIAACVGAGPQAGQAVALANLFTSM